MRRDCARMILGAIPKPGETYIKLGYTQTVNEKSTTSSLKSSLSSFLVSICLLASQFIGHWHGVLHLTERPIVFAEAHYHDVRVLNECQVDAHTHHDHFFERRHSANHSKTVSHEAGSGECQVFDHLLLSAATLGQASQLEADSPRQSPPVQAQRGDDAARRYTRLARGPPDLSSI